jgi:Xaa-Pro aminopeptidase
MTDIHRARREHLLEVIGPGAAVFPSAPVAIRNNDVEHEYRQDSDLHYLTGFEEPESVLVLTNQHPEHRAILFLRERDPTREVWDGARLGVERAPEALGVDAAFPIKDLAEKLPDYLSNVRRLHCRLGFDRAFDEVVLEAIRAVRRKGRTGVRPPTEIVDTVESLHEMRMRKSPAELEIMRRAAAVTREAHVRAMQVAKPGVFEYEVEAEILRVFRKHGSQRPAYGSIVGSGPNATVLHYRRNDRRIEEGDLLLIDAGCEIDYVASDVTRTFPVSGKFTAEQRALYDIVLEAQKKCIDATRPGASIDEVHDVAVRALSEGLLEEGLVAGSLDEVISEGKYKPYYMHRTSHWLGMDVHDVGTYFVDGKSRPLEPGFVITIEPGLYIARDADVDPRWRGIGIRIEDDVLVTVDGHEVITADVPKEPGDVERVLAQR